MKAALHSEARSGGIALVIVLAFLVLLTGLTVAFFSRALSERQISNSSAAQTRTELLARSALDTIVGDLKQEITAGSSPTPTPPSLPVYNPSSKAYSVPQQSGTPPPGTGGFPSIPNLIRRSVRSDAMPTPGVASRASAVNSTSDASSNGRTVSLPRWNSHYLIPCHNTTANDSTPISPLNTSSPEANGFTPPDWVMVTTSGPKVLAAPDTTTIGRYAYAIYDEGGLLDANVAGCPQPSSTASGTPYPAYKGSLAFADLTQLPVSKTANLPQSLVNTLVGWRNYASSQPTGSLSGGYTFSTAATNLYYQYIIGNTNGFLSVNPVPSPSPATSSSRTDQMFTSRQALLRFGRATGLDKNVLQYLGTFTRELNAPNFIPRASSVPSPSMSPLPITYVGDASNPNPSDTNPIVQSVSYTNTTATNKGQPVVSQRFPLSRLALFSDPVNNAAAIKMYFGLSRTSGLASTKDGYTWNYVGSSASTGVTVNTYPQTLATIAALAPASGSTTVRAPDFFEDIQAAVLKGSLGVYSGSAPPSYDDMQRPDILARTVMQIGADLIDQYKSDGQPTTICFTAPYNFGASTQTVLVSGMQNLPYFSELLLWPYRPLSDSSRYTLNVYLMVELWNPHRNATSLASPGGFVPSNLRFCFDSRNAADYVRVTGSGPEVSMATILPTATTVTEVPAGDLQVVFNNSTRFAEPTVLDSTLVTSSSTAITATSTASGVAGWGVVNDGSPSRSGFLVGSEAVKCPDKRLSSGAPYEMTAVEFTGANSHLHLQFQDSTGVWRDYQGEYTTYNEAPTLTLGTGNGDWVVSETGFSEYNSNATNISFSVFGNVGSLSMQQEDPRGTMPGEPVLSESTFNLSMRPGTSVIAGASPSGAKADLGGLGSYASYDYPLGTGYHGAYPSTTPCYMAMYNENAPNAKNAFIEANSSALNTYALDIDGVFRPGDGYYGANPYPSGSEACRPVILNRPFRSVGEMGYAYRGYSWKSVNFFSPESGDAGLLDFFSMDPTATAAGKVNLNTRQPLVLQAVLMGAYRTQPVVGSSITDTLSTTDAAAIANAIVAHTIQQPGTKTYAVGPLTSRADLVRELLADPTLANPPGTTPAGVIDSAGSTGNTVKEKREAFIRALADIGTTRTWNLLIDVVAQTGIYPPTATSLSQFSVLGEKHYWMHVAIDRYTGQIIDQQLEPVDE